ncbi:MAG: accessory gene regulator B family protein [Oscillospiraceae bacterium]|jgi:accessory gene regulator B|nr:accessory gene regulator B family protein [Oscillospiraceae bacterium]
MFNHISEKITENMVTNGTVVKEDKEIYLFGIQQGLVLILNLFTTVVVSLIFKNTWQMFTFMLAYILLRSFAGGYHAKTAKKCYAFSILLLIIISLVLKYIKINAYIFFISLFISSIVIFLLSPVDNKNRNLDILEKRVFRKITIVILIFEVAIAVFSLHFNLFGIAISLFCSPVICAILLILGKVENKFFSKTEKIK